MKWNGKWVVVIVLGALFGGFVIAPMIARVITS